MFRFGTSSYGQQELPQRLRGCTDPAFFECNAVELAQKLLGKYLYCHQSGILLRIIETEAFPHGDAVYHKVFSISPATQELPCKAGELVALIPPTTFTSQHEPAQTKTLETWSSSDPVSPMSTVRTSQIPLIDALFRLGPKFEIIKNVQPCMHAGVTGYIAQLEARIGISESTSEYVKKSLVIFPYSVARALKGDWEDYPALYEGRGVQLHVRKPDDPRTPVGGYPEDVLHSPRVLSKAMFKREFEQDPPSGGILEKFRFDLQTKNKYLYAQPKTLEKMT
jgi:hypothetical protein